MSLNYFIFSELIIEDEDIAILEGDNDFLSLSGMDFDIGVSTEVFNTLNIDIDKYSLRGKMSDYLNIENIHGLVLSDIAQEFFREYGIENIEFFRVILTDSFSNYDDVQMAKLRGDELNYETVIYENYYLANIVGCIDCIDHIQSDVDYFSFQKRAKLPEKVLAKLKPKPQKKTDVEIDFIRHLVLDESKIPNDIKVFRLKDCPRILVFKDEIVDAIKKAGLTGFVFIPLEEYTDEIPDDDDLEEDMGEEVEDDVLEPELTEEQKAAKARYETQQEKSRIAYEAMQERIRIRRERGEGPSLV